MLKKSLLVTSFLFSITFVSHGADRPDAFETLYQSLRAIGLEGDELHRQMAFMLEIQPISAEVLEKKLPDSSSAQKKVEDKDKDKEVNQLKEVDQLKVHEAFDGQTKYIDPLDYIASTYLQPLGINHFTVKNSSIKNYDCFFFSIIGENLDLLTQVLEGNRALAQELLHTPESLGRDFTPVRRAFFNEILKNLTLPIQMNDNPSISVEELVRSIIGGDRELAEAYKRQQRPFDSRNIDIRQYFDHLCNNHVYLDDTFSVIFSYLYNVPVYVLNPCTEPDYESLIVQSQTTSYYRLPATKAPIYIYHLGWFGGHYWKLQLPSSDGTATPSASASTPPSSIETSSAAAITSSSSSTPPSPVATSVQEAQVPSSVSSASLLLREIALDSSKLNNQKLILKLTKPVSPAEAQKLAESVTAAIITQNTHNARLEKIRREMGFNQQEFEDYMQTALSLAVKDIKSIYDPTNAAVLRWLSER